MYYPFQTFHIKSCIFKFLLMENLFVKSWCNTNQGIEESQTECLEEIKNNMFITLCQMTLEGHVGQQHGKESLLYLKLWRDGSLVHQVHQCFKWAALSCCSCVKPHCINNFFIIF